MYKDKDKQRQAVREAVRRHRAKGITQGKVIPTQSVTPCNTPNVIPKQCIDKVSPAEESGPDKARKWVEPEPQSHNSMMVGYVPKEPKP